MSADASSVKSLSELSGMAQRCLYFYQSIEKPFKAMVMMDYERRLSEKVISLVDNQIDMNIASVRREDGYLLFNAHKDLQAKCSELDLMLLKLTKNLDLNY